MTKFLMYLIYLVAQKEGLKSASQLLFILAYLGVDCVLVNPIDLSYCDMDDLDAFVANAHDRGIKVVINLDLHGLNWFPDGKHINWLLVQEFREIVKSWIIEHDIDGFKLDMLQVINKSETEDFDSSELLFGSKGAEVISAIFPGEHTPLLIMECVDPTFGGLTRFYTENSPVDFVMNVLVKDIIENGEFEYTDVIKSSTKYPQFMLNLEDYNSPRFPARPSMTPEEGLWRLFNPGANAICLYQGQELGLETPTDQPIPPELYKEQMGVPGSFLSITKMRIDNWRKPKRDDRYI